MTLKDYLKKAERECETFFDSVETNHIHPEELRIGTLEYFKRGGKRLRPAILMLSAGALGGKDAEKACIPAACAVELFHTFTLIHDDIIDNDPVRRGGKSVHVLVSDMLGDRDSNKERRDEYGRDVAILAGDMLHALSATLMLKTAESTRFSPKTVFKIATLLENECLAAVLDGEALDTRAGLIHSSSLPFSTGTFEETLEIMEKKTGMLFAFAAKAGAMLGLDTDDETVPEVMALEKFACLCGIAFQLQDDILGIIADEKKLGKPVGSDIREGKHTVILQEAYKNASEEDRGIIECVVNNKNATPQDIERVKDIFKKTGAVDKAKKLASDYISRALKALEILPPSEWCNILKEWALFMSDRSL